MAMFALNAALLMTQRFIYFNSKCAESIHDKLIALSGGRAGTNNLGLIEGALSLIQNNDCYPEHLTLQLLNAASQSKANDNFWKE